MLKLKSKGIVYLEQIYLEVSKLQSWVEILKLYVSFKILSPFLLIHLPLQLYKLLTIFLDSLFPVLVHSILLEESIDPRKLSS